MTHTIANLEDQIEALAAIAGPGIAARVAKLDELKARLAALRDAESQRPAPWSAESQALIDAAGAGRCACRPAAEFVCRSCDESIHDLYI